MITAATGPLPSALRHGTWGAIESIGTSTRAASLFIERRGDQTHRGRRARGDSAPRAHSTPEEVSMKNRKKNGEYLGSLLG
ncbi:hypothetical protein [Sorangium sp. So ce854]|uniref:hypothetical protein n=1 Tax=Sorangium sp. So ce854 TaxID=3133322 RepID=UPI003F5FEA4D